MAMQTLEKRRGRALGLAILLVLAALTGVCRAGPSAVATPRCTT